VVWLYTPSSGGFVDVNSRLAYFCHKYVLATGLRLPTGTSGQATALWPSGFSGSFPALSATDAFAAMTGPPIEATSLNCAVVSPLIVTAIRLGTYPIGTDRGTAQMSAWLFTTAGMKGDLAYPALAQAAIWGGGKARNSSNGATVNADDRTLTYSFYGTWCASDYKGAVAESSAAVAIAVKAISNGPPQNDGCRPRLLTIALKLGSPLAGRVVVDDKSRVVVVCPPRSSEVSLPGGETARC
jgi:hypothetical protein